MYVHYTYIDTFTQPDIHIYVHMFIHTYIYYKHTEVEYDINSMHIYRIIRICEKCVETLREDTSAPRSDRR